MVTDDHGRSFDAFGVVLLRDDEEFRNRSSGILTFTPPLEMYDHNFVLGPGPTRRT
jgi:hypothetical protein